MKIQAVLFLLLMWPVSVLSQSNRIQADHIRTLRVVKNGDASLFPVIDLHGNDHVDISFDDMTHVYHRYLYRVIHCNADWTKSEGIFDADYIEGTAGDNIIDDYAESRNTTVLYTHYRLTLPNADVKFRVSGNYRVEIYDDASPDDPVCTACVRVVDNRFGILAQVLTNTDVDWNATHQQIEWSLHFGGTNVLSADREIKTIVMQNGRVDNQVVNARPTFVTADGMQWKNCRDLIFTGGNEYRKFEILNLHLSTLGVERMRWFAPYYHAELTVGQPRRNYIYAEDQDGRYVIRNEENANNDTESEYVVVHYALQAPERTDGDYYVDGAWADSLFAARYKMTYDANARAYVADLLQKQGYYNYQYLFVQHNRPNVGLTAPAEGDFYQTENQYTILVYYHPQNGRYDQLVGFRDFKFLVGR